MVDCSKLNRFRVSLVIAATVFLKRALVHKLHQVEQRRLEAQSSKTDASLLFLSSLAAFIFSRAQTTPGAASRGSTRSPRVAAVISPTLKLRSRQLQKRKASRAQPHKEIGHKSPAK